MVLEEIRSIREIKILVAVLGGMGFTAFDKHCLECEDGKPCGKMHVYALILDQSIASQQWFIDVNPNYEEGKECLYVGRTEKHVPKCRASAHQYCKTGSWKGKKFFCYCTGEGTRVACSLGSRGSSKVDKFNRYQLRKKLFRRVNPQEDTEANKKAEEDLALSLRKRGFGVWAGHLDAKSGGGLDEVGNSTPGPGAKSDPGPTAGLDPGIEDAPDWLNDVI